MNNPIFHILSSEEWREVLEFGVYTPSSLEKEGFIHCCTKEQVPFIQKNWFQGMTGLVLLEIIPEKLSAELRYEDSHGTGELFPHIYGPLNIEAVVNSRSLN
jgi:uncharacterized protein (DUF952 family)